MRKSILLSVLMITLLVNVGSAQFSVGLRTAVISNDVVVESGSINLNGLIDPALGWSIGPYVNYSLGDALSVQSELLYKKTGFEIGAQTDISIGSFNLPIGASVQTNLHYLELPLLLQYERDLGNVSAYVAAGPSINYAMSGNIRTRATGLLEFNLTTTPLNLSSSTYNRWGIGGNVGAGVSWPAADDLRISADLRYSHDFSSLVEVPIINTGVRNRGWSIGVGVSKRI